MRRSRRPLARHRPFTREALESGGGCHGGRDARRRAADLPGAVLRRPLAGPGRLPASRSRSRPRLGDHAYEVLDTKLARQVKPHVVHQLSLYNRLLAAVQGSTPALAHLVLGDGSVSTIDLRALSRPCTATSSGDSRARGRPGGRDLSRAGRALRDLRAGRRVPRRGSSPTTTSASSPVRGATSASGSSSSGCRHGPGARPRARRRPTPASWAPSASSSCTTRPTCRCSPRSSRASRPTGTSRRPRRPATRCCRRRAPATSSSTSRATRTSATRASSTSGAGGRPTAATSASGRTTPTRRRRRSSASSTASASCGRGHPDLHVYHYAPHERSKLRSLSVQYATREDEVDELLRGEVLVDLYAVVRQGLQVGEESYSLKKLERHHGFARLEQRVREGGGSIVAYETWLETGDDELLEAIRAYNEEDCRSTALACATGCSARCAPRPRPSSASTSTTTASPSPRRSTARRSGCPTSLALIERLTDGLPARRRRGHRRAGRAPAALAPAALPPPRGQADLVALLRPARQAARRAVRRPRRDRRPRARPAIARRPPFKRRWTTPSRSRRRSSGSTSATAEDPTTGESSHVVADRRRPRRPAPRRQRPAAGARSPVCPGAADRCRRSCARRSDRAGASRSSPATAASRPSARLLRREPPRADVAAGSARRRGARLAPPLGLDRSVLPVQGPPGTGKTFRGARMIVAALAAGRRVGITAQSHAAIQNLLREIERCAHERASAFTGVYKGEGYESPHGLDRGRRRQRRRRPTTTSSSPAPPGCSRARSTARRSTSCSSTRPASSRSPTPRPSGSRPQNVVLLGDPQQLPQVTQADHPGGSGASVLEHLLDGASTIPPDRGVLLTETLAHAPRRLRVRLRAQLRLAGCTRVTACAQRRIDARVGR